MTKDILEELREGFKDEPLLTLTLVPMAILLIIGGNLVLFAASFAAPPTKDTERN